MSRTEIDKELQDLQHKYKDDDCKLELVSRLIEMLHMAQKFFGPRDLSHTIHDMEFLPVVSQISYDKNDPRRIIIVLNSSVSMDILLACDNLAHETVHLLAPTGKRDGTNLEEGVACYFADYYVEKKLNQCPIPLGEADGDYKRALEAVTPLLDEDIYCIGRLRERQPSFQDMTREDIIKVFPNLESKDVDFLLENFYKDSDR